MQPLLHTWSLAVEEQYYILFPPALWLIWKIGGKRAVPVLWIVGGLALLGSLGLAEYLSRRSEGFNFFMLPSRMWELLAGGLCALRLRGHDPIGGRVGVALSLIGGAALIAGFVLLAGVESNPNALTALPIVGVCLIVLTSGATPLARLLSIRPLVGIGLVSYSFYLWHQPVFAFARLRTLGPLSPLETAALVALSFTLAVLTWRFVEQPFRANSRNPDRIMSAKALGAILVPAAVVLLFLNIVNARWQESPLGIRFSDALLADVTKRSLSNECFGDERSVSDYYSEPGIWGCRNGGSSPTDDRIGLIGDSHSLSYLGPVAEEMDRRSQHFYYSGVSGCPAIMDVAVWKQDLRVDRCYARNDELLSAAISEDLDIVVLTSRWSYYNSFTTGTRVRRLTSNPAGGMPTRSAADGQFFRSLEGTIKALTDAGIGVVFIHQNPIQRVEPANAFRVAKLSAEDEEGVLARASITAARHETDYAELRRLIDARLAAADPDLVRIVDPADILCDEVCLIGTPEVSYYYDDDHLSNRGAALIVPAIMDAIDSLTAAR